MDTCEMEGDILKISLDPKPLSSMIKEFSRKLRMTLAEHSTEIAEENSEKK